MAKYEDYLLRNLQETDLEKVLTWRNSERVRINMYTNHIITWQEHLAWFQKNQKKENVIYLIFEFLNRPIGLICFTDLDRTNNKALGGFYLGEVDTSPRSGIAMEYLGLEHFFEKMDFRKIGCEVLAFNKSVIKFQKKFGFSQEGYFNQHIYRDGQYLDVVFLALLKEDWLNSKERLAKLAFR